MKLSLELEKIIEQEFANKPLKTVAKAVGTLRTNYRTSGDIAAVNAEDVVAYAAYRFPGTFAAITYVLEELQARLPDFEPTTLLDVGAGPGTGLWAVAEIWPALQNAVLVERDTTMINLGKRIAAQASNPVITSADWQQMDVSKKWTTTKGDLVIMSYALSEISEIERKNVIENLWNSTMHTLCIIEPAKSPRGPIVIAEAISQLQKLGAHILAPWTDATIYTDRDENNWTHFAQRVERSKLQRIVKGTFRSYEDEKFSYVIASRHTGAPYAARIILQPHIGTGHVRLELWMETGIRTVTVTKTRHSEAYKIARKLNWGDVINSDSPLLAVIS